MSTLRQVLNDKKAIRASGELRALIAEEAISVNRITISERQLDQLLMSGDVVRIGRHRIIIVE